VSSKLFSEYTLLYQHSSGLISKKLYRIGILCFVFVAFFRIIFMTASECTIDNRSVFKSTPLYVSTQYAKQTDNEFFCVNKSPACEISGICFVVKLLLLSFWPLEKELGVFDRNHHLIPNIAYHYFSYTILSRNKISFSNGHIASMTSFRQSVCRTVGINENNVRKNELMCLELYH